MFRFPSKHLLNSLLFKLSNLFSLRSLFFSFTFLMFLGAAFVLIGGPAKASFQAFDDDVSDGNALSDKGNLENEDRGSGNGHAVETVSIDAASMANSPVHPVKTRRDPIPAQEVDGLDQGDDCDSGNGRGGILRYEAQTFPGPDFPKRGEDWDVRDLNSPRPGFLDEVEWGLSDCDPGEGRFSLWSVGGGSIGQTLNCSDGDYFTSPRRNGGIHTVLRFGQLKLGHNERIRITFDYKTKMPENGLFIGLADATVLNNDPDAALDYRGFSYFEADTNDEWVRKHTVNCENNGPEFDEILADFESKERIEIGIFYRDPAPLPGAGAPTDGMFGAFIDSVLIDVKIPRGTGPMPSPSPTDTPSPTATATISTPPTATFEPPHPRFTPTGTPGPKFMPLLLNRFLQADDPTAIPTVPSDTPPPTNTPSATPTPSRTPTPTETFTPTPTSTPVPTDPPIPFSRLHISWVQPFTPGKKFEYIEIFNEGTKSVLMDGWEVAALKSALRCTFREGLVLDPGQVYEIRGGKDATDGLRDTDTGPVDGEICYHRNGQNMFLDNNQDIVVLTDGSHTLHDRFCWSLQGPYLCFP